jgi:hypothetical protein
MQDIRDLNKVVKVSSLNKKTARVLNMIQDMRKKNNAHTTAPIYAPESCQKTWQ